MIANFHSILFSIFNFMLQIVDISQHAIAMKQNYVKEVINTINLKPSEFNLTAEQFCDVFDVCQYTTVVISSSTEKFGLGLTDHLKNITGKVDAEPSNSNITQGNSKFLVGKIRQFFCYFRRNSSKTFRQH